MTLETAVTSLLAAGQRDILLSLNGVESISAKGLGELVSAFVIVKNGGGQFRLFNLTPTVRQLMQTTNLFEVFQPFEDEARALDSFGTGRSAETNPPIRVAAE